MEKVKKTNMKKTVTSFETANLDNTPVVKRAAKIPTISPEKKQKITKISLATILLLLFLGLSGTSFYFYRKYKNVPLVETDDVIGKIGKLMVLPEGETPTLATVTDIDKVKNQEFFAKAENGDKVLIYTQAKKAILYRPSLNKIVGVTVLSVADSNSSAAQDSKNTQEAEPAQAITEENSSQGNVPESVPAQQTSVGANVKVAVYNGSGIKGLAVKLADKALQISGTSITEKGNATGNFTKNIVVDISGNNAEIAAKIADEIGGEVGSLPEGETAPNADILIIGGKE
jgi:hypothetical protein